MCAELGFERLTLSLDLNDWGQDKWRAVNDQVDMHKKFDLAIAPQLIALGKELNVEVTFWFLDEKYETNDLTKLCPWPFERAYISSDLRIVPCCMVATPDVYELGDARHLLSEWNGEQMKEFRKAHLSGNIPNICKSCYKNN